MDKKRKYYKYEGLENYDISAEERDYYCYFKATSPEGKEYEVYTNRELNGAFSYNERTGNYIQTAGTMQFSMPGNKALARKFLKKQVEDWGKMKKQD